MSATSSVSGPAGAGSVRATPTARAVPFLRRPIFALAEQVVPGLDRARIWKRLDLHAPARRDELLELQLMKRLVPLRRAIGVAMGAFFLGGTALIWGAGPRLEAAVEASGHPLLALLVPFFFGVLAHGLFAFVVHEATHGNVLGRPWDDWVGNGGIGLLLLPFLAERYQALHRLHHRRSNQVGDTNWTPFRQRLFRRSRLLYALYELVPVVNNLDRIRDEVEPGQRRLVLFCWLSAAATWAVFQPSLGYWAIAVTGVNAINALRLWVEHFGFYKGRVSNTYWCPLGFGIGNHEVHHLYPRIPAVALMAGLWLREKDGSVFSSPWNLLLGEQYAHFRTFQPDFTGDNV